MNTIPTQEPTDGFLRTPEGQIHFLDWGGNGPQVHFLHGNGFCAGTYTPFLNFLIAGYHIYASDVRGHGQSNFHGLRRIRHWEIFARDLKDVIEKVMIPPITGIGHSLGAVTTFIAAAKYPDLFNGLVMIDPVILPRGRLWFIATLKTLGLQSYLPLARITRRRKRVFANKQSAFKRLAAGRGIFKSWSKEFIAAYIECGLLQKDANTAILKCEPELEAQIFESIPLNIWSYANRVRCPVLAVRGVFSNAFGSKSARRLQSMIRDYEFTEIPHAGHFVPMEQPHACSRVIKTFLNRVQNK